jgi:cytochrome c-type biogenesis protein CcmH
MVLFVSFAILAAAVTWAVTRPLLAQRATAPASDPELAVYRDQLSTIESERAEGLIGGAEAEGARIEVARRLIKRSEQREQPSEGKAQAGVSHRLALIAGAGLPVLAIALYLFVGQPGLPGRPYAARLQSPVDVAHVNDLIAKVEAHLREAPEEGRGWDVLAPVYMRMGEFQQAADAYARAIKLQGESPQRLAGFARASIMQQNGIVDERARAAFEKVRALDPDAIEPKVWLAIAKEQDGDLAAAASDYRELTAAAGAQEPWKSLLAERSKGVAAKLGGGQPDGGPTSGVAAAPEAMSPEAMSPPQQQAFIEQMVSGLAEKLQSNGKDLDGWMRLVRAYTVLGRVKDASTALASARTNFAGDPKALEQLQALAQVLGIGS